MEPENLVEEMNNILFKMDKDLRNLNKTLDKILKTYPQYMEDDENKLRYAMYKFQHGK